MYANYLKISIFKHAIALSACFICYQPAGAAIYFVAPNGSDSNGGSKAAPWHTFQKAADSVKPGDTVYLRGISPNNVYFENNIRLSVSGTALKPITFAAYGSEQPIIDGSRVKSDPVHKWNGQHLINVYGNYIIIQGIEVRKSPAIGIYIGGDNVTIDGVHAHHNYFAGIYFYEAKRGKAINNHVHHSYDYGPNGSVDGGDADCIGASASNTPPPGNDYGYHLIKNNSVHDCSDDGIDTWTSHHNVIEGNTVHHAGYTNDSNGDVRIVAGQPAGNGNGFKLGPGGFNEVRYNVAYSNRVSGFDSNDGINTWAHNNTAYENQINFSFWGKNRLSDNKTYAGNNRIAASVQQVNNNWNAKNLKSK